MLTELQPDTEAVEKHAAAYFQFVLLRMGRITVRFVDAGIDNYQLFDGLNHWPGKAQKVVAGIRHHFKLVATVVF